MKCHALEKSITELQLIHDTANPDASSSLAIISQAKGDDETGGGACSTGTGSSKRSSECDAGATVGGVVCKRSRPSPHKDEKDSEVAEGCVMEDDAEDISIPMEMCVAVLRSRAVEREEEVKRLRSLVQARAVEFSTERKQLVGKLMASEQARRESEAALETNDTMWQQLVQNQMAVLQQKIAAQAAQQPPLDPLGGHALPENDEEQDNDMRGVSQICSGRDAQLQEDEGGGVAQENRVENLEMVVDVESSLIEEGEEKVKGEEEATSVDAMEAAQSAHEQELGGKEVGCEGKNEEKQGEEENTPKSPESAPPKAMSPASALVAKWATRRKTIGGAGD